MAKTLGPIQFEFDQIQFEVGPIDQLLRHTGLFEHFRRFDSFSVFQKSSFNS